jgi:hypothetical protein
MALQQTVVGPNRRISGAQAAPRSESDIRVDIRIPNRIIAAANNLDSGGQAQFSSANGGTTWQQATLPLAGSDDFHSDPTVGWTSDGTAWTITLGIDTGGIFGIGAALRARAYRSTDGGATWSHDAVASGSQTAVDKEMMWVDRGAASPFANRIYVIWHNGQPAFVNRRTGPTGTWQTPVQVSGAETTGTAIGGDITTNSTGEVFAFWPDTGSRRLLVARSTNGGASFQAPVAIATTFAAYDIGVPAFAARRALIYLSGAAYRDAADNFVYAVWTDLTGAPGCTSSANEPGSNTASNCKSRIWFARSVDGGTTWQQPTMLNGQASRNDQFNPRLAVDDTDGTLMVAYYDTVGDPGRLRTNLWYQSSADNGTTWTDAVQITTAATDESAGADANQYGDYNGLTGYSGLFSPSWTDRRGNGPEEVWTASVMPDSVTDLVLTALI